MIFAFVLAFITVAPQLPSVEHVQPDYREFKPADTGLGVCPAFSHYHSPEVGDGQCHSDETDGVLITPTQASPLFVIPKKATK